MRAAAFLSHVLSHSDARRRAPTLPLLEATHLSEWEVPKAFGELLLNGSLDA